MASPATVLSEGDGNDSRPVYLLLPVKRTPSPADIEEGRRFLGTQQACPELVTDGADAESELLVALGWPPKRAAWPRPGPSCSALLPHQ
jgi:hypothetical protein